MRSSIEEVLEETEVVVVTNRSRGFRNLSELMNPEQILLDFVGVAKKKGKTTTAYEGICW